MYTLKQKGGAQKKIYANAYIYVYDVQKHHAPCTKELGSIPAGDVGGLAASDQALEERTVRSLSGPILL